VSLELKADHGQYWDYIIPDNGLKNPYFKNPARNEQYAKPGQDVNVSAFPRSRNALIPMPLRVDVAKFNGNESSGQKESDGEYVFLEITRATEPIGLVLTAAGDGTYKRIGYFYIGRRDLPEEEERDGFWTPGEREWDWNEDLEIRIATIV
jgi:hypothetical protein